MCSALLRLAALMLVVSSVTLAAQATNDGNRQSVSDAKVDSAIRELLKSPPYFVDEQHPGPTMFPQGLGRLSAPLTCRASQAFSHWVTPGAYHFQKAEYLLGLGSDSRGCEIFGLEETFEKSTQIQRLERAVTEATAAVQSQRGMEMWRSGAADYVLVKALKELSVAVRKSGNRQRARELSKLAGAWEDRPTKPTLLDVPGKKNACSADAFLASAQAGNTQSLGDCLSALPGIDIRGSTGRTALMEAAFAGHDRAADFLLRAGANVNARDVHGGNALREAVALGHETVVERLLANQADFSMVDEEGNTALHDAAALGLEGIVFKLLVAGANPNVQASDGTTPLMAAMEGAMAFWAPRQIATARHLLTAKANVNLQNKEGLAPLMIATRNHQAAMVSELIQAGAIVDMTDNERRTALYWAADATALEAAAVLLEHGAKPDIRTQKMETALIRAGRNGYRKSSVVAELLLRHGADPNAKDRFGVTPVLAVAYSFYRGEELFPEPALELFRVLIKYGADVRMRDDGGSTALHRAAEHPGPDTSALVQFLVDAGLNVNQANDRGTTALMLAAEQGHVRVVRFLLDKGADPRLRNSDRMTALDFAQDYKQRRRYRPGCIGSTGNCSETREILKAALTTLSLKR